MTFIQAADVSTVATSYGPIITGAAALLGVAIGSMLQVVLHASERSQKYKDEIRGDIKLLSSTSHVLVAGINQLHDLSKRGRDSGDIWQSLAEDVEKAYLQMDRLAIGLIACRDSAVSTTAQNIQSEMVHIYGAHTDFSDPEALNQTEMQSDFDKLTGEVFILLTIISTPHRWYRKPMFRSRKAAIKQLEAENRDDDSAEPPAV